MIHINKIYCKDNITGLKELPDNCIDLTVTSPPYNLMLRVSNGKYISRSQNENNKVNPKKYSFFNDNLPIEKYYKYHKQIIKELLRISKIICYNVQIVTGSKEAIFKIIGNFSSYIKDIIIWDKGAGQPAMHEKILNRGYEMILILENDKKPGRLINNSYFERGSFNDILRINRNNSSSKYHKAGFPKELPKILIMNFSKKGDLVLDPFMGSGTTAIAALELKRNYLGYEISQEYCDIAEKRIETWHKQTQDELFELGGLGND